MTGPHRIGDLASEFGVSLRTLRFYEDRGLLSPERRGTRRLYSDADREKLGRILQLARFDFSLTEIARLMTLEPGSGEMLAALAIRLQDLDDDIAARMKAREDLRDLIAATRRERFEAAA
ncbi:MerR family transcriptional regulator [Aurantimonas coralicida]|uniref:MerR family transcriptional regulator n=1 Tax=Aurantimonas coralicida TaxID=182270 RepID=UPI001E49C333|nr:MerR family transcriptional regulator [Aurantimonas coralicida]MCD1644297.1 MerR family transcriptional regulator [Aurantimonas coralicida]